MRYKKVLLLVPATETIVNTIAGSPLLSTGYISESLQKAGIAHQVLDMTLGYSMRDLEKVLLDTKPDLVGVTLWSYGYKNTYEFLKWIKRILPEVSIITGGPHVSTLRNEVLEGCDAIDYGAVLEGELTLTELCQGKLLPEISGLIHRKNGTVIYNGDRDFIGNLDALGFPRYESFELDRYPLKKIFITTSRGCPYNCTYCPVSDAIGRRFRMRSAASVTEEIEYWYKKGYRQLDIQDDNFTLLPERTRQICELLIQKDLKGLILTCNNGIRADKVNKELLNLMFRAGIKEVSFGVEVSSDRLLAVIRKGETIAQIEQAISWACDIGFKVQLFFIVGAPTETYQDFIHSTELALRYPVYDARFYNLIPFPKTELYEYVVKHNLLFKPYTDYLNRADHYLDEPYFATPEFSRAERIKALDYGRQVSRTVMRRYVTRAISKSYGQVIGSFLGPIVCSAWFINLSRNNPFIKRMVYLARTRLFHK